MLKIRPSHKAINNSTINLTINKRYIKKKSTLIRIIAKANAYRNSQINPPYYRSGSPPHTVEIGRRSSSGPPPHTVETGRRSNVTSPFDLKNSGCFQIFIKTLSSCSIALEIDPYQSIRSIKSIIQDKEGIFFTYQRLTFAGKELEDQNLIRFYSINQGDTILLSLRIKGGMITSQINSETFNHSYDIIEEKPMKMDNLNIITFENLHYMTRPSIKIPIKKKMIDDPIFKKRIIKC